MKRIKALVAALLALAMVWVCGLALAEGERDLYFTPGEDLVILERDGLKISLKGEQPEQVFLDGIFNLAFSIENSSEEVYSILIQGTVNDIDVGSLIVTRVFQNATTPEEDFVPDGEAPAELAALAMRDLRSIRFKFVVSGTKAFEAESGTIHFNGDEGEASAAASYETLDVGSKGDAVKAVQEKLIALGYLDGGADGVYGKGTAGAVNKFQAAEGLPETGAADPETQERLFSK